MGFADVITLLNERGLHVRRTGPDRLQVIGDGDIGEELASLIRHHRDDFLQLLPTPQEQASRIWGDVVEQANRLLSGTWSGTDDQWRELDAIEQSYTNAFATGDLAAVRRAADDYVALCTRYQLL